MVTLRLTNVQLALLERILLEREEWERTKLVHDLNMDRLRSILSKVEDLLANEDN